MKNFIDCEKKDCFANHKIEGGDKCTALADNDFKGECPFYKGMSKGQKEAYIKKMNADIKNYCSASKVFEKEII